ncbi:MAG: aminoacyl-tRNA hydrolase [Treponema sp.]|nr:aminoacyl-tRNA hydrolase [Treponema sp.]
MIQLVAFLGNPGTEYSRNRHNAGRMLAEVLPFFDSLSWQKKYGGWYTAVDNGRIISSIQERFPLDEIPAGQKNQESPNAKIHFLMPETYMNLSGKSVFGVASFFKIRPEKILLVHDELELPLGTISLKFSGGLGGHNGLRSMKSVFGTADFWRLRIGIGRPDDRKPGEGGRVGSGKNIAGWVLSDFSDTEWEMLVPVLDAGADLLMRVLVCEPETLLPYWAKKKISTEGQHESR